GVIGMALDRSCTWILSQMSYCDIFRSLATRKTIATGFRSDAGGRHPARVAADFRLTFTFWYPCAGTHASAPREVGRSGE
ncbi:MAG TPA: hypothetical protein VE909_01880, partial [Xanthobacteraceae bacterium]|nr:hypothetical protein [Xanthobacteraceae bacterium]